MRLAVTVAENVNGKWDALALPDVPIQVQKDLRKKMIASDGEYKGTKYRRMTLLSTTGEVKRAKFSGMTPAEAKARAALIDKADKETAKRQAELAKLGPEKRTAVRNAEIRDRMKKHAAEKAKVRFVPTKRKTS